MDRIELKFNLKKTILKMSKHQLNFEINSNKTNIKMQQNLKLLFFTTNKNKEQHWFYKYLFLFLFPLKENF